MTSKPKFFSRLRAGLSRTRDSLISSLGGGRKLDREFLEGLEDHLIMADVGMETTTKIMQQLETAIRRERINELDALYPALERIIQDILEPCARPLVITGQGRPFVIMVVGINGAGKTTSIGKITHLLKEQGHTVLLAAADTFRAAASEQLQVWGQRNGVDVIAQAPGADAAAVTHDALDAAIARDIDVLVIDTAGRQHTSTDLMQELEKIHRVAGRKLEGSPHEVLLVLDAGIGQNALSQLEGFDKSVGVTGLCLTKLDGTAKGGIVIAIADRTGLPIRFIGVGEGIDDLQEFDAGDFVKALIEQTP